MNNVRTAPIVTALNLCSGSCVNLNLCVQFLSRGSCFTTSRNQVETLTLNWITVKRTVSSAGKQTDLAPTPQSAGLFYCRPIVPFVTVCSSA